MLSEWHTRLSDSQKERFTGLLLPAPGYHKTVTGLYYILFRVSLRIMGEIRRETGDLGIFCSSLLSAMIGNLEASATNREQPRHLSPWGVGTPCKTNRLYNMQEGTQKDRTKKKNIYPFLSVRKIEEGQIRKWWFIPNIL